jgi:hypothetical protein
MRLYGCVSTRNHLTTKKKIEFNVKKTGKECHSRFHLRTKQYEITKKKKKTWAGNVGRNIFNNGSEERTYSR